VSLNWILQNRSLLNVGVWCQGRNPRTLTADNDNGTDSVTLASNQSSIAPHPFIVLLLRSFAKESLQTAEPMWRMSSSEMWRRVALVRNNVSGALIAFIIRVTRTSERGTLAVTNNRRRLILVTLITEVICSSETSVLIRVTRRNISEVGILHSHRRE
jgi:hypothetical protein